MIKLIDPFWLPARADLLAQWAHMESAGIDFQRTMEVLRDTSQRPFCDRLSQALRWFKHGTNPIDAWRRANLLQPWEHGVLSSGFESGRLEASLRMVADAVSAQIVRRREFLSKLTFPFTILLLASLLAPLVPLVRGDIGFFGFIVRGLLPTVLLASLIFVVLRRFEHWKSRSVQFARWAAATPVAGSMQIARARGNFLTVLALALRSGVPAIDALILAARSVHDASLAPGFAKAASMVRGGQTVHEALLAVGALDPAGDQLVRTGEFSGTLDEMIERAADRYHGRANDLAEGLVKFLPKLIYGLVMAFMVVSLLS